MISIPNAGSKPVATTPIEDALEKAPIILLAESGQKEFDNLREGEIRKSHEIEFDCRKQAFKILKVYRNKTNSALKIGQSIELNNKSNGCIDFDITIQRKGTKLEITHADGKTAPYTIDITNKKEKVILFLQEFDPQKKLLEHYGWFVSPDPFTAGRETQIIKASYTGAKKGTHLTSGCE